MSASPSKTEQAYAALRRDILDARLVPGLALTIASLEARYALGWTPLREALSRLETERLVSFAPNRGFRVAGMSRDELYDLQRARRTIDAELLRLSILEGGEVWEEQLVAAEHALRRVGPLAVRMPEADLARWEIRHDGFHAALLDGGNSPWLRRLAAQTGAQLHRYHRVMVLGQAIGGPRTIDELVYGDILASVSSPDHHTALMRAALDRDLDGAQALLAEHVGFTLAAYDALGAGRLD